MALSSAFTLHRRPAVGRRGYLFAGSHVAGERAAIAYSVLATCRLLGIDPTAFLTDVLPHLAREALTQAERAALAPPLGSPRVSPATRPDRGTAPVTGPARWKAVSARPSDTIGQTDRLAQRQMVLAKWANFGAFRVKYNRDHTAIVEVEVRPNRWRELLRPQKAVRADVVAAMGKGRTFVTIYLSPPPHRAAEGSYVDELRIDASPGGFAMPLSSARTRQWSHPRKHTPSLT